MAQKVRLVSVESDWNVGSLKQYIDMAVDKLEKRITSDVQNARDTASAAQAAAQLANVKSEKASDDRFAGHNEFNRRIDGIVSNSTTRGEFTQLKEQYAADQLGLSLRLNNFVSGSRHDELRTTVEKLTERINTTAGEKLGKRDNTDNNRANIGIVFGACSLLVSIALAAITLLARHGT